MNLEGKLECKNQGSLIKYCYVLLLSIAIWKYIICIESQTLYIPFILYTVSLSHKNHYVNSSPEIPKKSWQIYHHKHDFKFHCRRQTWSQRIEVECMKRRKYMNEQHTQKMMEKMIYEKIFSSRRERNKLAQNLWTKNSSLFS